MSKFKIFAFFMLNVGVLLGLTGVVGKFIYDQAEVKGKRDAIAQVLIDLGDEGRRILFERRTNYRRFVPTQTDAATLNPRDVNIVTLQESKIRELQRELAKDPQNNILKSRLASAYFNARNYNDAIRLGKEVLLTDSGNYSVTILLAYAYLFNGDDRGVISMCEKILEKTPDFALIEEMLAQAYYRTNQYERAVTHFKKVLQANPTSRIAKSYLGIIPSSEQDKWAKDAAEGYKELSDANPNLARLYNLAMLNLQRGNAEVAKTQLKQIVDVAPIIAMAQNNLALLMTDLKEAIPLVQKAVAAFPDNPYFLDTLGLTHMSSGNMDQALDAFKKAYVLAKDNGEILYHLGLAHYNKANKEEAIKYLGLAVGKELSSRDKQKATDILKKLRGF